MPPALRLFWLRGEQARELPDWPAQAPDEGILWVACTREHLAQALPAIQARLLALTGLQLVDLHISDLLNPQLPSHYDYTSQYDLLVLHRLRPAPPLPDTIERSGAALRRIDTDPVGFAVFDQLLLSVHPDDCRIRDTYAERLLSPRMLMAAPVSHRAVEETAAGAQRPASLPHTRLPTHPSDLMLRLTSLIVDHFLELRRELSHQLNHWQAELLRPRGRFADWDALLEARLTLHRLDEICEDQRAAMQDWVDALETWPAPATPAAAAERDLLKVRSRDVLEHIERVVHHVRRLEHSTETTVQMHFSVLSNRTNDIMRTLTALTAVFLPLNLIAAIFGMNFDRLPLIHSQDGFWWAMAAMLLIALALLALFWRKRYLTRMGRER